MAVGFFWGGGGYLLKAYLSRWQNTSWANEKVSAHSTRDIWYHITFLSRQTCWKNSIEWIRNWCFLYSLEDVIISGEILESHIGNDKEYEFGLDIGLGFRHVWTRPTYSINNNIFYFIFELVNLYTTVIFETVFQF